MLKLKPGKNAKHVWIVIAIGVLGTGNELLDLVDTMHLEWVAVAGGFATLIISKLREKLRGPNPPSA